MLAAETRDSSAISSCVPWISNRDEWQLPVRKGVIVSVIERCLRCPAGRFSVGLVLLLVGLTGCGSSGPKVIELTKAEDNLKFVALAYMEAHSRLGRPPKNTEDLKPFLKEFGNPEELLVSPNDGQPYVVVWGADPTRGGPTEYEGMFPILAYESKGSGGKRAVTDIRGRPMTIPEGDLPKLTFVGRHKPSLN
jgi:hypothetical protein